ncbi:MAG: leucyl/phenylalanyl-tRNA--protein transferase, partial [Acidobacteria bacterium]|nr:leucyl/phenylalanyl-tRNA--protein transferase [Acidobacteriota bacterium]
THNFPEWVLFDDYFYYARDIVSFGDPLTVENLRAAYRKGIFPWYMDGVPLPWYCPERRAVLDFKNLHIPRSLEKERRRSNIKFTIDKNFASVIAACSRANRAGKRGTWITPDFVEAYTNLHLAGMAHSVEAWDASGSLVGGLYGVDCGGVFAGESMFHLVPNASKLALIYLIEHLKASGSDWLDVQVMTPHLQNLGAEEISRKRFLQKLKETQKLDLNLF